MSPELAAAMRLLDQAKAQGFRFERVIPGPDGPLLGVRRPSTTGTPFTSAGSGRGVTRAGPAAGA